MITLHADIATTPTRSTRVLINPVERRVWLVHRERVASGTLILRRDLGAHAVELLSESSALPAGELGEAVRAALGSLPVVEVGPRPRMNTVGYWPTTGE
jgi:hypothetical protein